MSIEKNETTDSGLLKSRRKILYTFILVSIIFAGKFTGAFVTHSLALFSDSWHLLTDIASLIISWWGLKISTRRSNEKYTFGYYRYGILTALINNVSLILISLFIFYKAILRYLHPVDIQPAGMIIFAILGLTVNIIIVTNLRDNSNNMNVKSVFLHFIGDALSDTGVLLGGIIIYFTKISGVDTLLSAVLACLILKNALTMTFECVKILLEAAPEGISINSVRKSMKKIENVREVTDMHIWSLSKEVLAITAHVSVRHQDSIICEETLHKIQHLLKEEFNIDHSTIQFEHSTCSSCFHSKADHKNNCMMCIDRCEEFRRKDRTL